MWRVSTAITGVILGFFWLGWALPVHAASSPVLIVAIQTGGLLGAGQERIVLANTTNNIVSLDGVRLEYFAAAPKSFNAPSRTIKLIGSLAVGTDFTLVTQDAGIAGDMVFAATLAATGGHLRLVGPSGEWDYVGWGTAAKPYGQAAPAPLVGQTLLRRQQNGMYLQTGDNAKDFWVESSQPTASSSDDQDYNGLQLSELLPDPQSPVTDAEGEFIEIYNNGLQSIQLGELSLVTGTTSTKTFQLPDDLLSASEYRVYYASQSKLSLGNGGGRVQLQALAGTVLSEITYGKVVPGSSWAWSGTDWQWTNRPTPGQTNTFQTSGIPSTPAKQSVQKKITKKTAKSPAKKTVKKGEVKSSSTDKPALTTTTSTSRVPVHNGVVAGVGGLAVLYGAYEYRHDARNFIAKLRRNGKSG